MLTIDVVSIFPRLVREPLSEGIMARAQAAGLVALRAHDLRDFSEDRHRTVDDAPFGGGPGMVMKAEPFFRAVEQVLASPSGSDPRPAAQTPPSQAIVLLSPRGQVFDQPTAVRYAGLDRLVLLCGRYEGIDERVAQRLATEEVSLGDFVLTGGEVAAVAIIEATVRLLPGALGDDESARCDSFADGVLDWPHYTRPAQWRGLSVPEVLLSGDHARVRRWRRREALRTTRERRPELLTRGRLTPEDDVLLRELEDEAMHAV